MFYLVMMELIFFVLLVQYLLQTKAGKKVSRFLPTPFWIYFLSILLGTLGVFPLNSHAYSWVSLYVLPTALILMLIGTPLKTVLQLGPRAFQAVLLAMGTMFIGTLVSFSLFATSLPEEGWKMAGAMLGTWTGGSANMVAVKELVGLSDKGLGPLIVMDTLLSYGWLALLMMGVAYQNWFDKRRNVQEANLSMENASGTTKNIPILEKGKQLFLVLVLGFFIGSVVVFVGHATAKHLSFLSGKGWSILFASTVALLLALTKLNRLEEWKSSQVGTFLLYMVLASMGAKTSLLQPFDSPVILLFGFLVLLIHGILLFSLGRVFRIPLFFLATGSQANVGGAVSAPIVAGVYRPGAAHIGVLMALIGAIFGTYIGGAGSWIFRHIQLFLTS